jgi:RimJ/RimL family protein N-acetyltransferase
MRPLAIDTLSHRRNPVEPPDRGRNDYILSNGRRVVIRPIELTDVASLVDFHEHLSLTSIHNRFFDAHPHLTAKEATYFTNVDHHQRMAFVALVGDEIVGVGRYEALECRTAAEVAFVVADDFQRQGLGTILLALLVEHARQNRFDRFVAQILASNVCMREVFAHSGLSPVFWGHRGVIDVELDLGDCLLNSAASEPVAREEGELE